jgi:hypothetical protein
MRARPQRAVTGTPHPTHPAHPHHQAWPHTPQQPRTHAPPHAAAPGTACETSATVYTNARKGGGGGAKDTHKDRARLLGQAHLPIVEVQLGERETDFCARAMPRSQRSSSPRICSPAPAWWRNVSRFAILSAK